MIDNIRLAIPPAPVPHLMFFCVDSASQCIKVFSQCSLLKAEVMHLINVF